MRLEVTAGALRLSALLLLSLTPVVAASSARAQPCVDCLKAGAAAVPLRVPAGAPLGGYGSLARRLWFPDVLDRYPHAFWFRPSQGERDPLLARALVLETPHTRLAWVSVDLVAVDGKFTDEVERRLFAEGHGAHLMLSASHTHSGPGGFLDGALVAWLAMDRRDDEIRGRLIGAIVDAVRAADGARRPARLAAGSVSAAGLTRSRLGRDLDSELVVLKVTATRGAPVALVWNYAIHGTMLGPRNLRLSGDVTAAASRALEQRLGVPALFVNGAVGDVSPARHGEGSLDETAAALAAAAAQAWARAQPVGDTLAVRRGGVSMPPPRLRPANCVGGWLPRSLTVPLGGAVWHGSEMLAVAAGDTAWVTIPGELQTALGARLKQEARPRFRRAFVAGLSNGYLGYFVTADAYERPAYITCAAIFGAHAGECLTRAAGGLLARLDEREGTAMAPLARCGGAEVPR